MRIGRVGFIGLLPTALVEKVIPQLQGYSLERLVVGGLVTPSMDFDRELQASRDIRVRLPLLPQRMRKEHEQSQLRQARDALTSEFGKFAYFCDALTGYGKRRSGILPLQLPYSHSPAMRMEDLLFVADLPGKRLQGGDGVEPELLRAAGSYGASTVFFPSACPPEVYQRVRKGKSSQVTTRKLKAAEPCDVHEGMHFFKGGIVDPDALRYGRRTLPGFFLVDKPAGEVTLHYLNL